MQELSDNAMMWLLPSLPVVLVSLSALLFEKAWHSRAQKVWMTAHYGRVAGILIFGLAFMVAPVKIRQQVMNLWRMQLPIHMGDVLAVLLCIGLLIFLQRTSRGRVQGLESYSEANIGLLSLAVYSATWIVYLLLYEVYFRGYLLTIAFQGIHVVPIMVYNLVLYALAHLNKNMQQVMLSVPFGLLLCLVTLLTGHLWFAVIVHCWLALGVELPLLTKNRYQKILTQ